MRPRKRTAFTLAVTVPLLGCATIAYFPDNTTECLSACAELHTRCVDQSTSVDNKIVCTSEKSACQAKCVN